MTALAMSSAACATTGRGAANVPVPRPFPGATTVATAGNPVSAPADATSTAVAVDSPLSTATPGIPGVSFDGRSLAQFAMGFRGVPYRLGGADPTGFDCSGLVQYVFAQYGIEIPRIVEEQYEVGNRIEPSDLKPGDLIFFNTNRWGDGASHVAISIGGDSFVHAPNSTGVVRVETLGSNYWGSRYIGARRVSAYPAN